MSTNEKLPGHLPSAAVVAGMADVLRLDAGRELLPFVEILAGCIARDAEFGSRIDELERTYVHGTPEQPAGSTVVLSELEAARLERERHRQQVEIRFDILHARAKSIDAEISAFCERWGQP